MRLRMALLVLLVFASSMTVAAMALNMSTPISLPSIRYTVSSSNSLMRPLGDPINGSGFPH